MAAASIATFVPKDRALSPTEIRLAFHQLESIATYPTIRLALRMVLLTLVRKSELIEATWSENDFENATWTIPKQRMKGRNPHVVYLSRQALDMHNCAGPAGLQHLPIHVVMQTKKPAGNWCLRACKRLKPLQAACAKAGAGRIRARRGAASR